MINVWSSTGTAPGLDLQRFVELTGLMGSERFSSSLLDCLDYWVSSQHFCVMRMDLSQPSMLMAGTRHHDSRLVWRCWHAYAQQFHSHDQLFSRMQGEQRHDGAVLLGHILAEDIQFAPYRQNVYLRNGMSERLSGLSWDDQGVPVLFNLYRHHEAGYFPDDEIEAFEQLTPIVLQLLRGHLAMSRRVEHAGDWRQVLLRQSPQLTEQELEVCMRLLQGMTHAGIAVDLGVKESTVKTYRNRAFDRLGINFRNQLFALVQGKILR